MGESGLVLLERGEREVRRKKCSESKYGKGVLILTNRRLVFDRMKDRGTHFTAKIHFIKNAWSDGGKLGMEIRANTGKKGELRALQFSVSSPKKWRDAIQEVKLKAG